LDESKFKNKIYSKVAPKKKVSNIELFHSCLKRKQNKKE
jgi:hypothetical protein